LTVTAKTASAEISASASGGEAPRLTAYVVDGHELHIRPAPLERDWMDDSDHRFAYRCLPLNIANTHGWEVLCGAAFSATWDGLKTKEAIRIRTQAGKTAPAISHFGGGVLTFHIPCLFRTDPGVDLFVTGPINRPKDGIAPLSGIIETDWSPYTFTMNWLFTRAYHKVRFEAGEPFCHIFPLRRGYVEEFAPNVQKLSDNPELASEYENWRNSRNSFNADLKNPASEAAQAKWQKAYFQGSTPNGHSRAENHRSRLKVQPFRNGRQPG
jgi:hypothetical protein